MIKVKRLNDFKVQKLKLPNVNKEKWIGRKLFKEPFCNINIVARKMSGKTNLIYNILKKCSNKHTEIHIFCSTCLKDRSWIEIIKYLENRGNVVHKHTSIFEDGDNLIERFMLENNIDEEEDEEDEIVHVIEEKKYVPSYVDFEEEEVVVKKPKKKKKGRLAPEHIIIFDDLSGEMRNKSIDSLYKANRHYKLMTISSSQSSFQLTNSSRKQQDYWIIMKGMNLEKLKEVHKDADVGVKFDNFLEIYKYATMRPYSFLYIDTRDDSFRSNFDNQLIMG